MADGEQHPFRIDDPNDVINRVFEDVSSDAWDAFRKLMWELTRDPWPLSSAVQGVSVAKSEPGDIPNYIAPFDDGRGLLWYFVDSPSIVLVDYDWLDIDPSQD